jgi:hypothetical protein
MEPFEFIRRFLQHVLPARFHRVRRFGWLHPAARVKLNRVRALLKTSPRLSAAEQAAWQPLIPSPPSHPSTAAPSATVPTPMRPSCPRCDGPLVLVGRWRPKQDWREVLGRAAAGLPRTIRPP